MEQQESGKQRYYKNVIKHDKFDLYYNPKNNFTAFPILNQDIWDEYKDQEKTFWVVEEIDLTKDYDDMVKQKEAFQKFIKHILAFFAASDGIVSNNLNTRFIEDVQDIKECQTLYTYQAMMENIHSVMYSLLIEKIVPDENERFDLFNAIETMDIVREKAEWAKKWTDDMKASYAERVVAFICVEGIFFSSSFASIYWVKELGLMPGLTKSNEFISRDEGKHTTAGIKLYNKLYDKYKASDERIQEIFKEAIAIEQKFITESIPCDMINMNKNMMSEYIEYVADRLLVRLGVPKLNPNSKNPFNFMNRISVRTKNNMFERDSSNYSIAENGEGGTDNFDAEF